MKTVKPDSRQIRVSQEVLMAIMKDQQDPLESTDAILRRKYGLKRRERRYVKRK
jgi:hypothetical protein